MEPVDFSVNRKITEISGPAEFRVKPCKRRDRTSHACAACSKTKTKCEASDNGAADCRRCQRLGLHCHYVPQKRKAARNGVYEHDEDLAAGGKAVNPDACSGHDFESEQCELIIMRTIGQRAEASSRVGKSFDVPAELFREFTLRALHKRDVASLGLTMTVASKCGLTFRDLLCDSGTSNALMSEFFDLLTPSAPGAATGSMTESRDVAVLPVAAVTLPPFFNWLREGGDGRSFVMVKRSLNGEKTVFVDDTFARVVMDRAELESTWAAMGQPLPKAILHPQDVSIFVKMIGSLWMGLAPLSASGSRDRLACSRDFTGVRIKLRHGGYACCDGRAQLVVTSLPSGQLTFVVIRMHVQNDQQFPHYPIYMHAAPSHDDPYPRFSDAPPPAARRYPWGSPGTFPPPQQRWFGSAPENQTRSLPLAAAQSHPQRMLSCEEEAYYVPPETDSLQGVPWDPVISSNSLVQSLPKEPSHSQAPHPVPPSLSAPPISRQQAQDFVYHGSTSSKAGHEERTDVELTMAPASSREDSCDPDFWDTVTMLALDPVYSSSNYGEI